MPAQRFFIHCAEDFSLEQDGADEISIFPHIGAALEQARKLLRDAEARLTVFDPHGTVIIDSPFPSHREEGAFRMRAGNY